MIYGMSQNEKSTKVYIEIVKQLRQIIEKDGLKAGDKIPSERELSERLIAGRSSVREALRALELLGLIETRRGEGTYIRDFRGNQLVQLLSTFILQDKKAIQDVVETKQMIELDCLQLALSKRDKSEFKRLKEWTIEHNVEDIDFFTRIIDIADNHLMFRIWQILVDYYRSLDRNDQVRPLKALYVDLADALEIGNIELVQRAYRRLRNLSDES